jgi:hypothetical protein
MWTLHGPEEGLATTPGEFMLDRLGDEAAPVPLEPVDSLYQFR